MMNTCTRTNREFNKYTSALGVSRKNELSTVFDNSFFIFKENDSLHIYGESLTKWLSIGGLTKGRVKIAKEKRACYYTANISSDIFFKLILKKRDVFDVLDVGFGYKVVIKTE